MTDDGKCDKDESEEDDYEEKNDSNSNDTSKKKYGKKDDAQEEFIDSIQKNIVNTSSNYGRHELFKWAFKFHKNENYTLPEDVVNDLLLWQESDLDHVNRLSIFILKNWVDNDEDLGQLLRQYTFF